MAIPAGSNVSSVGVGYNFSCALLNGGLVCWGSNTNGQLANPDTSEDQKVFSIITNFSPPAAPTIIGSTFDVTSITLTFSPPANNGGSAVTGYQATCMSSNVGPPTNNVGKFAPANATTVAITGLTTNATYTCTLTATNIIGTGPASNSISAKPLAPSASPIVAFTAPSVANLAQGTINIGVSAQTSTGTLTLIEIFDGPALLTSIVPPAVSAFAVSYDWAGMTTGTRTLVARATNSQGLTTSTSRSVGVFASATVRLANLDSFYLTPASIDMSAIVTAGAGTTIARVIFFANNGTTNAQIGATTIAPYNFRWQNVAAGNYAITARVQDSNGITVISTPVNVTVGTTVGIQFSPGLSGSTVDDDTILIGGTVSTPPNSAVNINGRLATVTSGGQFFLNDLSLQAGPNTVTATVTTADGQTAGQTITINRGASVPLFEVSVGQGGIVIPGTPVDVDVTIGSAANTPFATINIDCVSPSGGSDVMQLGTYKCRYAEAGTFEVRVAVKNGAGGTIYTVVKRVKVETAQALYNSLVSVYSGVIDRLKVGNIDGAVNMFTGTVREKYRAAFAEVGAGLPALAGAFGGISSANFADGFAELIVIRITAQGDQSYPVTLVLCSDGIWRIDGF